MAWNRLTNKILRQRQKTALKRISSQPFCNMLRATPADLSRSWRDIQFLSVDIETTGLDPQHDQIVSFGWVPIEAGRIHLREAEHLLVGTTQAMNASATIHGLRDHDLSAGLNLEDAMIRLLNALHGRVLVVHYSGLDKQLLDRVCKTLFGATLLVPMIDTLTLARHQLRHEHLKPDDLRLASLIRRFHLPPIAQHDAICDALATAQLLLALIAHVGGSKEPTAFDLMGIAKLSS